jgi:RNA recognition motif-containing protein
VEKVWFRSIQTKQTDKDNKAPKRVMIIKKEFDDTFKDNKSAYVLFEKMEDAKKAAQELNQHLLDGKHIRVDMEVSTRKDGEVDEKRHDDCETSVFVGNLPYIVNEEELRTHFATAGKILNVRVVRDPKTFLSKGIGYIQYATKAEMRDCIESLHEKKFQGRKLRIKKAVAAKRLEKKQNKKAEKAKQIEETKKLAKMRNFEDAYDSDDSQEQRGGQSDSDSDGQGDLNKFMKNA